MNMPVSLFKNTGYHALIHTLYIGEIQIPWEQLLLKNGFLVNAAGKNSRTYQISHVNKAKQAVGLLKERK